ncbi:hypothetical protein Taro_027264 [Colocasia esculenta]|uniref:Uncharacterized protein n=1 Tax=Colocasia esculenta TaxID=4460 RepID=A0A843VN77_COLES|nr:hypothetical protein [Colocasia esculenta]
MAKALCWADTEQDLSPRPSLSLSLASLPLLSLALFPAFCAAVRRRRPRDVPHRFCRRLIPPAMASITPDSSTALCAHCGKDVPSSNIDLHFAFCFRNLEKCRICDDMIPKKNMDEHYHNSHAPVDCSLCSQTIERELLDIHRGEKCPQRIVTCEYCEFPLPAVDLSKHQEVCGNRTEYCNMCNQYVRLREWDEHEIRLHYNLDGNAQSSRVETSEREERGVPRRQANNVSRKHMMFTIAVTGAAVLIGSFFLQKSIDSHQAR